jgi:hypothetical protein
MNANTSNKLSKGFYRVAIGVAAIGIAAVGPAIQAKPNPNKGDDKPANVVAHVQLSGGPVTRMLLVKKEGKEYLLVGLNSTASVAVFDVSNPDRPRPIDTASSATGEPSLMAMACGSSSQSKKLRKKRSSITMAARHRLSPYKQLSTGVSASTNEAGALFYFRS